MVLSFMFLWVSVQAGTAVINSKYILDKCEAVKEENDRFQKEFHSIQGEDFPARVAAASTAHGRKESELREAGLAKMMAYLKDAGYDPVVDTSKATEPAVANAATDMVLMIDLIRRMNTEWLPVGK